MTMRAGVAIAMALVLASCARRPPPRAYAVTITNFVFQPATLRIAPGDTVVWKNTDIVPHTATARDGAFDSKTIDGGANWRWVATATGSHPYYCVFHPNMQAAIEVR